MSIRLDPRRLGLLKQLAGEAGVRPGDLVRTWVEERIDGERLGSPVAPTPGLTEQLAAFSTRLAAVEAAVGIETPLAEDGDAAPAAPAAETAPAETEATPADQPPVAPDPAPTPAESSMAEGVEEADVSPAEPPRDTEAAASRAGRPSRKRVAAAPAGPRVALHDEMIAVLGERGPMTAGELAAAIAERGRYAPPRSGKPLDAAMVSQRVSNPTYRARFTRRDGRIGLAEGGAGDAA